MLSKSAVTPKSNFIEPGSAHEWSGIWTGPNNVLDFYLLIQNMQICVTLNQCLCSYAHIESVYIWLVGNNKAKRQFFLHFLISGGKICSHTSTKRSVVC